ncbi:MAG TPA: hypothetical protein VHA74_01560 [Candidatus Dojkabacteria bacterium]|nr:hypothetical protein [Candidatus Dojkabacteria bacterium]
MLTKEDIKQLSDLFMPRFDQLDQRISRLEIRFDQFVERTEEQFYDLEEKFDRKLGELEKKMNNRFDMVNERFDKIENHLKDTDKRLSRVFVWVSNLDEKYEKLNSKFEEKLAI